MLYARQRNCSVIAYSTSKVKGNSSVLPAARNIKYFDISLFSYFKAYICKVYYELNQSSVTWPLV